MRLIEASKALEEAYIEYIEEWEKSGEKIVPMASSRNGLTYDELLEEWAYYKSDRAYEKGFVPATTYYLVDDNDHIKGSLNIRHTLNDHLLREGGHVGYGVRPSERGNAYAELMVKLAMEKAVVLGLDKVLITCNDTNAGSYRTIEKLGGVLENKVDTDGGLMRRYWLSVGKTK